MEDNGPGIPKESREHVFEMFYSGKNKVSDSRRSHVSYTHLDVYKRQVLGMNKLQSGDLKDSVEYYGQCHKIQSGG